MKKVIDSETEHETLLCTFEHETCHAPSKIIVTIMQECMVSFLKRLTKKKASQVFTEILCITKNYNIFTYT